MSAQTIYPFKVKAEPTRAHPEFFKYQYGWLFIWILADSLESAAAQAFAFLRTLPFEALEDMLAYPLGLIPPVHFPFEFEAGEARCLEHGSSHYFFGAETGADPDALIVR